MIYFLENNNFPRFQRGSNILRGGGGGGTKFSLIYTCKGRAVAQW